ncbi:unnamed protein product [Didymodactylos carnosus]|uniref:CDGSH iron-sulfur domain-containing protein 2 homologue n=1 Tax=Didymodactylos carnosus TaxID=1234261 RepID=A0A814A696_9BILA|nr:unnamed protein product [Didymodactylos carnosus]CAF3690860.1 unnamed protein product [Didymodactylos carnosus]
MTIVQFIFNLMDALSYFIRTALPAYLKSLPIPENSAGYAKLTARDYLQLVPFVTTVLLLIYLTFQALLPEDEDDQIKKIEKEPQVNQSLSKDKDKVVHVYDIKDIQPECDKAQNKSVSYCRCWKSKKFPLCDGTHNQHNKDTGDNVGPLVVTNKKE